MATEIVQVRIDSRDIEFVDFLVKAGICRNKSEAIRYLLSVGISSSQELPQIVKAVEDLKKLEKESGEFPIKLPGATKILMSERDRFS